MSGRVVASAHAVTTTTSSARRIRMEALFCTPGELPSTLLAQRITHWAPGAPQFYFFVTFLLSTHPLERAVWFNYGVNARPAGLTPTVNVAIGATFPPAASAAAAYAYTCPLPKPDTHRFPLASNAAPSGPFKPVAAPAIVENGARLVL